MASPTVKMASGINTGSIAGLTLLIRFSHPNYPPSMADRAIGKRRQDLKGVFTPAFTEGAFYLLKFFLSNFYFLTLLRLTISLFSLYYIIN